MHVYEVRPRKEKRGIDLISDELGLKRLYQRVRLVDSTADKTV